MIKSGKILFRSMIVIAVLLLTFTTTGNVTFASEVATPESTVQILPTETSNTSDYLSDVQEALFLPIDSASFSPTILVSSPEQEKPVISTQEIPAPVWVTESFTAKKWDDGRTVTAVWVIATNTIIREVNATFKTGADWTEPESQKGPNAGGVRLQKSWTYGLTGTYSVGAVAQIYTDLGPASCFAGPRIVVIF